MSVKGWAFQAELGLRPRGIAAGAECIPWGPLPGISENSVITPSVVMRPILLPPPPPVTCSVSQTLPSGPAVGAVRGWNGFAGAGGADHLEVFGFVRFGNGLACKGQAQRTAAVTC
jgi:hypothetical protein